MKTDPQKIPGVGKNMEQHLIKAGYSDIASLMGQDPEEIYRRDCLVQGMQADRCTLYCYRLAVCFADNGGELHQRRFAGGASGNRIDY